MRTFSWHATGTEYQQKKALSVAQKAGIVHHLS